jgi:hypothetical protein
MFGDAEAKDAGLDQPADIAQCTATTGGLKPGNR